MTDFCREATLTKMGESGEPSERCFVNSINRGENTATITLDASGGTFF